MFKKIADDTPDAEVSAFSKMRKKLRKLKKLVEDTSDEEEVKNFKKTEKDASDEEEFKEFKSLRNKRKKDAKKKSKVEDVNLDVKNVSEVEDVDLDYKTKEDEKDDDHKFKQKVVNEVKEDDGPKEDPVKKETRSQHKDVLGNVLLVMQACFIIMATKTCDGCEELSKLVQNLSVHLEGRNVLDMYSPYRTRKTTVKTSSNCSNRYCYKFPTWMTARADVRELMCKERPYCKQLADLWKLTSRKLAQWKEGCLQDLKEGWKAARNGLAGGLIRLGCVLWDQELSCRVKAAISKDQVAVLER